MMKKLLLTLVAVVSLVACATSVENPEITVVPYPNELIVGEGTFDAKGAAVTYDEALDSASVKVINALAQRLSFVTGVETAVSAGQSDKGFVFALNAEIPSEAYTLDVTPEAVRVEASGLRGFNYAVQTIRQLLPLEVFASEPSPRTQCRSRMSLALHIVDFILTRAVISSVSMRSRDILTSWNCIN